MESKARPAFSIAKANDIRFLHDTVVVSNMHFDERISRGGIVLLNDDLKSSGIRPRWAKIYGVGPEQDDPELKPGRYILISHGRWTRGIKVETPEGEVTLRKVDINDILLVSDEPVYDEIMSDKV